MKSLLSFFLTLTILFSSHGVIYQASNAKPVEGWHCGMELCMCAHHDTVDPIKDVYDGFYASSNETQTTALSSSENERVKELEFKQKISSLNSSNNQLIKKENNSSFSFKQKIPNIPSLSQTIKPPQS